VSDVKKVAALSGVQDAAGSLTVTDLHVSGTVPKQSASQFQGTSGGFRPGGFGQGGFGRGSGGQGGFFGPNNINFNSRTITGIDASKPSLAAVTPSQITKGHYLTTKEGPYAAVLSSSYADRENLSVGSTFTLGGKTFHVVGLASAPLGGNASDIYVPLATLQSLSARAGRVTTIQVQAAHASSVAAVQKEISSSFAGAQVTTSSDLAKRVTGSLTDAKNLSNTLGTALEIIGLLAALLIACLLTLSSVAKRTREIGTLRAIGWSQALVIRQISLETVLQGVLGGVLGVILGVGAAEAINAYGITLKATVPGASAASGPFGFGRFAQAPASASSSLVHVSASVSLSLILLAVLLAVVGGLVAGMVGGLRAARLRPAVALRTVE
jgi:ABC-type antimicrobial peptide transport system permease subunit